MKKFYAFLSILFSVSIAQAQNVGIGATEFTPSSSALLELRSTSSGFLMPRMTQSQRNEIASPTEGLMIYQTNGTEGYYYYDGSSWQTFGGGGTDDLGNHEAAQNIKVGSGLGLTDTDEDTKIQLERTNDEDKIRMYVQGDEAMMIDDDGHVGIGISTPDRALHVVSSAPNTNVMKVQSTANNGWSSLDFLDQSGSLSATFGFANSGTGSVFTNKAYFNSYNHDFLITRNSSENSIFIKGSNGNIGIGTGNPQSDLHVNGDARISSLSGSGDRMVVADAQGDLTTQPIPSGGGGGFGSGTTLNLHLTGNVSNVNVSGVSVIRLSANSNNRKVEGFTGGVAGQVICIVNTTSNRKVKFEDDEGTQELRDKLDVKEKEGAIIMYDGNYWYILSKH